jgi:hypothetical protein
MKKINLMHNIYNFLKNIYIRLFMDYLHNKNNKSSKNKRKEEENENDK